MGQTVLKAVIFDMDGVIVDSEPIHHRVERQLFEKYGLAISQEEHQTFIGVSTRDMWSQIKIKHKLQLPIDELVQLRDRFFLHELKRIETLPAVPHVLELIAELFHQKIKLILASSSAEDIIRYTLNKLKVIDKFDHLVSGENFKNSKPSPEIFLKAIQLAEVQADECIVIEDSFNGVTAAINAGIRVIGFRNPNTGSQDLSRANLIIDNFADLDFNRLINFPL
jgi:HAD superfamily hydrolase (TIGR01509 family)